MHYHLPNKVQTFSRVYARKHSSTKQQISNLTRIENVSVQWYFQITLFYQRLVTWAPFVWILKDKNQTNEQKPNTTQDVSMFILSRLKIVALVKYLKMQKFRCHIAQMIASIRLPSFVKVSRSMMRREEIRYIDSQKLALYNERQHDAIDTATD